MKNIAKKYSFYFLTVGLSVALLFSISVGVSIWHGLESLKNDLNKSMRKSLEEPEHELRLATAGFLSRSLFTDLYRLDVEGINSTLEHAIVKLSVKRVLVADASGKVLTDGTPENHSYGTRLTWDLREIEYPKVVSTTDEGEVVVFPIGEKGAVAGYGELFFSHESLRKVVGIQGKVIDEAIREKLIVMLIIGVSIIAVTLVVGLIMSVVFSIILSTPLRRLRDAAEVVREGGLPEPVVLKGDDELTELAGAFNEMAVRVCDYTKMLEKEVNQLKGLLPICAYCKSIRGENGKWQRIESYIAERTEAEFTHGICEVCKKMHFDLPPTSGHPSN